MAITLLDIANEAQTPVKQTIILALVERMWTMGEKLPYQNISVLGATMSRISEIPSLQWRKIGQPSVAVQTRYTQFQENLRLIREHIDIDNLLKDDPAVVPNPVRSQVEGLTESIAYGINDAYINGDPTVNPEHPTGVDYRYRNDPIFQGGVIAGNDRGQIIDAAGLDVDGSDANMHAWLDHVHDIISRCDGKADGIFGNRQTLLKFASILRRQKLLDNTKDMFDRFIDTFHGIPLIDLGVKPAGAVTKAVTQQIFPHNTQTSPFAATANTSWMTALRFEETRTTGLQKEAMNIQEIGQLPNDPATFRIAYLEWAQTIGMLQRSSGAAIYGLVI